MALNFLGTHVMCPHYPHCPEVVWPMGAFPSSLLPYPQDQVRLEQPLLVSKCIPFLKGNWRGRLEPGASLSPLGREHLLVASPV